MSLLNWASNRAMSKLMDGVDTELALIRNIAGNDLEVASAFFSRFTDVIEAIPALAAANTGDQLTVAIVRMSHQHRVQTSTHLMELGVGCSRRGDPLSASALKMVATWIHIVDLRVLPETSAQNALRADNLIRLHEMVIGQIAAKLIQEK